MATTDGTFVQESVGQAQPEEQKLTPAQESDKALVQEVLDALKFGKTYEDLQRRAEDLELEFLDDMWLAEHRTSREEKTDDEGNKIPAKPTISVPLHDQIIQQVVTEARQARLALTVKPKAGLANTKIAGYFKGLIRSIQVESGALAIRIWALERTASVGRGGYRIIADYANDGDFDLDLIEERILDYSSIYWDPYGTAADRRNAGWNLEVEWFSEADRKRRWPNAPLQVPENAFDADSGWSDWFAADAENPEFRRVRVGTYRKVVHTTRTLAFHPAHGSTWLDKLPAEAQAAVTAGAEGTRQRDVDTRSVMIYICDGTQILERRPWHGRYIPVIETIGREYFFKGKRRFKGMLSNGIELERAINVCISAATEAAASMPRAPYIMYAGQDDGFEEEWNELFTANRSRVHVNAVDVDGKPAPIPQRQQTEIQANGLLVLIKMLHEMYHAVTGSVAPQMRAVNPYDRSGKAIEALQRQGQAGSSNFLDNLATISMPYEGMVLIDAIPHYYDREGRVVRVMGEENDDEIAIMIKRPFIRNAEGEPVGVPCQACQGKGVIPPPITAFWRQPETCPTCQGSTFATEETMPDEWKGKPVEYVDFGAGVYKVQAALDRDYKTKQDEALAGMAALAAAVPELVPVYADLWVRAMGFSGSNEIADRLQAQNPTAQSDEELGDIPPALKAKFQHLQHQHQQAMAALGETQKLLDTDAIKNASQKDIATIRAAVQYKIEGIKQQGKMMELARKGQLDERLEVLRGRIEGLHQDAEHKHEVLLQLLKELGAKEQERHSVALHDRAGAIAEARLEGREVRAEAREEGREVRTGARDEGREARTGARDEGRETRAAVRDEGREVRSDARADASQTRVEDREDRRAERARQHEATRTNRED